MLHFSNMFLNVSFLFSVPFSCYFMFFDPQFLDPPTDVVSPMKIKLNQIVVVIIRHFNKHQSQSCLAQNLNVEPSL